MSELRFLSKIEQVAAFLSGEIAAGRWVGQIAGRMELAAELGLNARTVEEALRLLEREGLLVAQGAGRRRRIATQPTRTGPKPLTIGILIYDHVDRSLPYHVDLVHRLEDAGHRVVISGSAMMELGLDVKRVTQMVQDINVDAWVVQGGSREILQWFVEMKVPVIAQFGRFTDLPIASAGVRKIPALRKALRRLHELGHRRIVMLAREERRKPFPATYEQAFLNELEALGIVTGRYHLPEWDNSPSAFHGCLDSLFQHTPPTALLLSEAHVFVATQQHLASMGLIAPRDVSLICDDPDNAFSWCDPPISHIRWDSRPLVSRILRWADRLARGIEDKRQRYTLAEWVEGGTVGPAGGGVDS